MLYNAYILQNININAVSTAFKTTPVKSELESTTPLERKLSDSSQSSSSAETIDGKVRKLLSVSRLEIVSLNNHISGKNWRSTSITMSSANCQEIDCQSIESKKSAKIWLCWKSRSLCKGVNVAQG